MNKRQEAKLKSKQQIMTSALTLFMDIGILETSTLKIAETAQVSHGSIFTHFPNREVLITEVLEMEVFRITRDIEAICNRQNDVETLFDRYLEVLSNNERFLSRIYKELPFLSYALQLNVTALEAVMRNALYQAIKASSAMERTDDHHIKVALTAIFATISFYLRNDTLYAEGSSVIQSRKEDIQYTFNQLFRRI